MTDLPSSAPAGSPPLDQRLNEIRERLDAAKSEPTGRSPHEIFASNRFHLVRHAPDDLEYLLSQLSALREENERLRNVAEPVARPLAEWHEDIGPVLMWRLPIVEPPHAGTPLDSDAPADATHFTPIPVPSNWNDAAVSPPLDRERSNGA